MHCSVRWGKKMKFNLISQLEVTLISQVKREHGSWINATVVIILLLCISIIKSWLQCILLSCFKSLQQPSALPSSYFTLQKFNSFVVVCQWNIIGNYASESVHNPFNLLFSCSYVEQRVNGCQEKEKLFICLRSSTCVWAKENK